MFNKKLQKSILLGRPKDDTGYIPEDDLIPLENMIIVYNKQLILNYYPKTVEKMYKFLVTKTM